MLSSVGRKTSTAMNSLVGVMFLTSNVSCNLRARQDWINRMSLCCKFTLVYEQRLFKNKLSLGTKFTLKRQSKWCPETRRLVLWYKRHTWPAAYIHVVWAGLKDLYIQLPVFVMFPVAVNVCLHMYLSPLTFSNSSWMLSSKRCSLWRRSLFPHHSHPDVK